MSLRLGKTLLFTYIGIYFWYVTSPGLAPGFFVLRVASLASQLAVVLNLG